VAEISARRVAVIAAVAAALVGGTVAGGVAAAWASRKRDSSAPLSGGSSAVATAAVVRTNLSTTVQVGGSISYDGSFAVTVPSGSSAQQVAQGQQQLVQAQQALANDEIMNSYDARQDQDAVTVAQNNADTAAAGLSADEAKQVQACAGREASTQACAQDIQRVSQDHQQLNQAEEQLESAQLNADRDYQQAQARLQSDDDQIESADSSLTDSEGTEAGSGTIYTSLPKVGDVISEDHIVYAADGVPVPLLYGSIAAYRAFRVGMSDGPDVGELTHDLMELGFGAGLTWSNHYSSGTAAAVGRWQAALGLPVTGTVLLGQAVFEAGPLRVTNVTPSVGQDVAPGSIIEATSITPVVTVALDVTQEDLVKPGDVVSIVLPDGTSTVEGRVQAVGTVASCPGGGGTGTGSGGPSGSGSSDQSPCESGGSGNSSTPTVTVTITLDRTPRGAALDQAPVNVNITTDRADDVLAVPVNALLALQDGGYGLDVVAGTSSHLVGVTTGLYSSTLVQVSGSGITAGTRVEVPSS
jgi:Putative peptidoglycan binding domain